MSEATAPVPTGEGELLELARRVAGAAKPGEALEVFVSRGVETDIRAYEGEVESLSSASSPAMASTARLHTVRLAVAVIPVEVAMAASTAASP